MKEEQKVIITGITPFSESKEIDWSALDALTDYYLDSGAEGIFLGCQTGEALHLSEDENFAICRRITKRIDGRMAVYAGYNSGSDLSQQAESLKRLQDIGNLEVVIWLSTLPSAQNLAEQTLEITNQLTGKVGIYESPLPEHRLFSDDDLLQLAESERIGFFKDTCRDNAKYRERLALIKESTIKSYQANLDCLPVSLEDGSAGYCGIVSATLPHLCVQYVEHQHQADYDEMRVWQDAIIRVGHPIASKIALEKMGIPVKPITRTETPYNPSALSELEKIIEKYPTPWKKVS